jgi:hypothetical protein
MSLATIRAQIKTIFAAVSGIGVVHDYVRWTAERAKMQELFKLEGTDKLHGWVITRSKTPETIYSQGGRTTRTHLFIIRGFYSVSDADESELIFQDLVEAICTAFRADDTLGGTAFSCTPTDDAPAGVAGIQVEAVDYRMFAGVLCHYAELHLYAQELL